ncbi:MAG TPA: folate-binding protein [Usitatibacter sp.]|nr:folate-binding protein [Usitatibacter sp.]
MSSPSLSASDARAQTRAARDGTIVADLSHNALIEVTGDDATEFLHAQFTNDVQALAAGGAQWNGWCSAKGRLLATFLLVKRAQGYLMLLPAEIAAPIAKRLGMFVLRSKVKIADASARFARFGVAGKDAAAVAATSPDAIALGDGRFVVIVPVAEADATRERLAACAMPVGRDAWEWTSIQAGIPTIVAATQEAFVPQMANFDLVGGVSFRKGCYPGQEIVARTQYRGILKRRMALAHVAGDAPAAGQKVYSRAFGDQAAGEVVSAAPAPEGGADLLVVAQIESLRDGDLHLDSPEGAPVAIRRQPAEAAAT